MIRRRLLAAVATTAILLAGCTGAPPVTRDGTGPAGGPTGSPAGSPTGAASSAAPPSGAGPTDRTAIGIADCPVTDPAAAPRPDGLPDLTLGCLGGGREVSLAGLRGEPTVVNVWAQWCAPCREEAPFLREVSERRSGQVRFLGVDYVDPQTARALAFAAEAGWRYPHVVDADGAVRAPFQMAGPPLTLLVDADGRVVHRLAGPVTSSEELDALLVEHLGVPA